MTDKLEFEIGGDSRRFVDALDKSIRSGAAFDKTIERLTKGQVTYNAALKRYYDSDSKRMISAQRAQEIAIQKNARAAQALVSSQNALASSGRRSSQSLSALGFALNDAQQFAFGFDQGIRSISNNLPMLVDQFAAGSSKAGTFAKALPYVGFAISAVSTAAVLLSSGFKEMNRDAANSEKRLNTLAEAARSLSGQMLGFKKGFGGTGFVVPDDPTKIAALISQLEGMRKPTIAGSGRAGIVDAATADALSLASGGIIQSAGVQIAGGVDAAITQLKEMQTTLAANTVLAQALKALGLTPAVEEKEAAKSLFQATAEGLAESRRQLSELTGARGLAITAMQQENRLLQEQAVLQERINLARLANGGSVVASSLARMRPAGLRPGESRNTLGGFGFNADGSPKSPLVGQGARPEMTPHNLERLDQVAASLMGTLQGGAIDAVTGFSEALAGLAINGGSAGSVFAAVMSPIADTAVQLGRILLATGLGLEALKKSLLALTGGPAIAAGLALIGIGTVAKVAITSLGQRRADASPGSAYPSGAYASAGYNPGRASAFMPAITTAPDFESAMTRALSRARLRARGGDLVLVMDRASSSRVRRGFAR